MISLRENRQFPMLGLWKEWVVNSFQLLRSCELLKLFILYQKASGNNTLNKISARAKNLPKNVVHKYINIK